MVQDCTKARHESFSVRTVVALVIAFLALCSPQLSFAARVDCSKARTDVEKLICGSPGLSLQDEQLATAYSITQSRASNVDQIRNDQRAFLARREQCSTAACIQQIVQSRISQLSTVGAATPNPVSSVEAFNLQSLAGQWAVGNISNCSNKAYSLSISGNMLLFRDSRGQVDEESLANIGAGEFWTTTVRSQSNPVGALWVYQLKSAAQILVTNRTTNKSFAIYRCQPGPQFDTAGVPSTSRTSGNVTTLSAAVPQQPNPEIRAGGQERLDTQRPPTAIKAEIGMPSRPGIGEPFTVNWSIAGAPPPRPQLRADQTSNSQSVTAQKGLMDFNTRWVSGSRRELVVVSLPESVRIAGTGFLIVPPGARMPYGVQFEPDRLKVVFPLHLAESPNSGQLSARAFVAGAVEVRVTILSIPNDGVMEFSRSLAQKSIEIIDDRPEIIVQDMVTPVAPQSVWRSPENGNGERSYKLHIYNGYFEIFNNRSGGKVARLSGSKPTFLPNGRFVFYDTGSGLALYDLIARERVLVRVGRDKSHFSLSAFSTKSEFIFVPEEEGDIRSRSGGIFRIFSPYQDNVLSDASIVTQKIFWRSAGCSSATTGQNRHLQCSTSAPTAFGLLYDADRFILGSVNGSEELKAYSARSLVSASHIADVSASSLINAANYFGVPIRPMNSRQGDGLRFPIAGGDHMNLMDGMGSPLQPGGKTYFERTVQHEVDMPRVTEASIPNRTIQILAEQSRSRGLAVQHSEQIKSVDTKSMREFLATVGFQSVGGRRSVALVNYGSEYVDGIEDLYRLLSSLPPDIDQAAKYVIGKFSPIAKKDSGYGPASGLPQKIDYFTADIGAWYWKYESGSALLLRIGRDPHRWCLISSQLAASSVADGSVCSIDIPRDRRDFSYEGGEGAAVYPVGISSDGLQIALGIPSDQRIWLIGVRSGIRNARQMDAQPVGYLGWYCTILGDNSSCSESARRANLEFSTDGRMLLQANGDGEFFLYSTAEQKLLLRGQALDDEFIVYDEQGFYSATTEGGRFVNRYFVGLREHHTFAQFRSHFHRPDIIRDLVAGRSVVRPSVTVLAPPILEFEVMRDTSNPNRLLLDFDLKSQSALRSLRLFRDGLPFAEHNLSGRNEKISRILEAPNGQYNLTAVAYDDRGFSSTPKTAAVQIGSDRRYQGQLRYVGIAVNNYHRMPPAQNLEFAVSDAELLRDSLLSLRSSRKGDVSATLLADQQATRTAIVETLKRAAEATGPNDVLVVSFAGHGAKSGDRFYYLPYGGSFADVTESGVQWSLIAAALSAAQGRVLVLLDACHSGSASGENFVPNDAYAAELMRNGRTGLAVLAAAKGRQFSYEDPKLGGGHGFFSYMISEALGPDRANADIDGSGTIELDELYRYVKRNVSDRTRGFPSGSQTPWLARDEFIGRVSLF